MNTDTPETDSHYYPDFEMGGDVVLADFARKLERERDEARKEMIRWMSIAEGRGRTDDESLLSKVEDLKGTFIGFAWDSGAGSSGWDRAIDAALTVIQSLTQPTEP